MNYITLFKRIKLHCYIHSLQIVHTQIRKMFAGALKTINSKYFKNITKNTKNFAQNPQFSISLTGASESFSAKNYFQTFAFQPQPIRMQSQQKQSSIQLNYTTLIEKDLQSRLHSIQMLTPPPQISLIEQSKEEIQDKSKFIQIVKTQTLQFDANSPIQDKIVCKQLQNINALCVSVFDGHGGSQLAEFASKKINYLIDQYLGNNLTQSIRSSHNQTINMIKNSINYAYDRIEQQFFQILDNQYKSGNREILKIGSCGLTTIIYNDLIIVANCGDSQGIIVKKDSLELTSVTINQQLNTNNLNQINRVKSQFNHLDDDVVVKSKINGKLYIKGVLQPTRTLGDYYLKNQKYYHKLKISSKPFKGPYLTHKPDFHIIPIQQSFKYLILASDGLWDFASKKQVIKIIEEHSTSKSDHYNQEKKEEQTSELTEFDLEQTYIEKVSFGTEKEKKLTEMLRDAVLDKCAKKRGKSMQGLMSVEAGERRSYCDDISIICVSFQKVQK